MEKQAEFLKQLNWKIESAEKYLEAAREDLKKYSLDTKHVLMFGLAKYAELVTNKTAQLEILYEQREIFESIFGE